MAPETITIDKKWYETLLSRVQLDEQSATSKHVVEDLLSVVVNRVEYEALVKKSQDFDALRTALIQSGIRPASLDTLIQHHLSPDWRQTMSTKSAGSWRSHSHQGSDMSFGNAGSWPPQSRHVPDLSFDSAILPVRRPPAAMLAKGFDDEDDEAFLDTPPEFEEPEVYQMQVTNKSTNQPERRCLIFKNLPPATELKEIVQLVCGGPLLNIHFRGSNQSQAFVSFFEQSIAQDFLAWTKREPLILRGRIIAVTYADKDSWVSPLIALKKKEGVSRNLLITGLDPGFNKNRIRDDLDHIHQLVVVDIFRPKDSTGIVVSLNAPHLALYARTCMRSQAVYKKAQISFYPDCCARPIPQPIAVPLGDKTNSKKMPGKSTGLPLNRFELLKMLNEEDESAVDGLVIEDSSSDGE